jgi:hypothetical protein
MGVRMEKLVDPAVPAVANHPIPHALGVVPDVWFLSNDTTALIVESAVTPADDVNVYVDSTAAPGSPATAIVIRN